MKILVTGDKGLVGTAFCNLAKRKGHEIVRASAWGGAPLTSLLHMLDMYEPTHLLHLAAKVGGVGENQTHQADFAYLNHKITEQVFESLRWYLRTGRKVKLCSVLSTCIYPAFAQLPLYETTIHQGPPHWSNYGYAYAKRNLEVMTRSHREQFNTDWISVVPCNVFGEGDNFSLDGGHVIPALVHKFYLAKQSGGTVEVWGDGSPLRQFVYSKDLAHQLLWALEEYDSPCPINLGIEEEVTIKETVEAIATATGVPLSQVVWDTTKPMGMLRKPASLCLLKTRDKPLKYTPFKTAIRRTVKWFADHYPNVRGGPNLGV